MAGPTTTGTVQVRSALETASTPKRSWLRLKPPARGVTRIRGTPDCRVKSWAILVTFLGLTASISFHRSSVTVLEYLCLAM